MTKTRQTFSGQPIVGSDEVRASVERALDAGKGILRLTPTWVPRNFLHPGRRIRLHPNDWYAYGGQRGGIDERWFGSTSKGSTGRAGGFGVSPEGMNY